VPPQLRDAAAFAITYRPMTDGDLPFVEALFASTRAEEVARTGWPAEMQAAFLRQQHHAQHRHYQASYSDAEWLIIEREGVPIGRLYLARQNKGRTLLLVDISLVPAARGAGLGTAIINDLLAGETRTVELHVERFNPAFRLYERLGFETIEEEAVYFRMLRRPPAEG
jgi:RimJ/RimL family protein N-acetyltransferase